MPAHVARQRLYSRTILVAALAFGAAPLSSARGGVKPGDFITADNAQKVEKLVSPGQYWRVRRGMTIKVVPTRRIEWPPPYREATERYSGQVRIAPNGRSLEGYVAGLPFPLLDPNDPKLAVKLIWNMAFRPMWTDDLDARYFGCSSVYPVRGGSAREIDESLIGHYRTYNEVGRTEVEPIPTDPDFRRTGRYFLLGLYPLIAPQSLHGLGLIRYRYADPTKGDDTWSWRPGTRRLRRLNEAFLGTAAGVNQFNADEYAGFNAKNENYRWRFLGQRTMLAAMHVAAVPGRPCPTDGGGSLCPAEWEMRQLYIVEGAPDRRRVPEELYARHIVYLDSESFAVVSKDSYDRSGELMVNFTAWMTYRDRPVPGARVAIYPFKRLFVVNSSSVNVQSGLSTFCSLPVPDAPERECWYINMGAVDKEMCTIQAMVRAAP